MKERSLGCHVLSLCSEDEPNNIFSVVSSDGSELPDADFLHEKIVPIDPDTPDEPEGREKSTPDSDPTIDEGEGIGRDKKGERVDAATEIVGKSSTYKKSGPDVGDRENVELTIQEVIRLYKNSKLIYDDAMRQHLE